MVSNKNKRLNTIYQSKPKGEATNRKSLEGPRYKQTRPARLAINKVLQRSKNNLQKIDFVVKGVILHSIRTHQVLC